MRAVLSLVRASLAGIGGFALVTAAFCVAMTLAISGPPTPQEMAEVATATQVVLREADVAARAFGAKACRQLDLECAPQQDAQIAPRAAPQRAEPPTAPIIIAEVAPGEPTPEIAAAPEEPQVTPPRARERAARRTPNVRARRAAARQERVRPHRRETTGARPHRAPRPRHSPVPRATPHAPPPAAQHETTPAEEARATTVNAPQPRAEPAPEQTPSAARHQSATEDRQASPAEEHNAHEQAPAPEAPELPPSSDAT